MVAENPILSGRMSLRKKFNATVINDIWPEVFFFSAVATMVACVSEMTDRSLNFSPQLLTVLGTVLGLVISFRTSSAYERYQDGRKMWTNIAIASRNLAQQIWIHVPFERVDKDKQKAQSAVHSVIEKKSMVNLVQAFSVSVKHFLRNEPGVYYEDLYPLVSFLPRHPTHVGPNGEDELLPIWRDDDAPPRPAHSSPTTTRSKEADTIVGKEDPNKTWVPFTARARRAKTFDPEQVLPTVAAQRPLRPARNPPKDNIYDYLPFLLIFKPIIGLFKKATSSDKEEKQVSRNILGHKKRAPVKESNVPLEITLVLSNYAAFVMRSGLVQPSIAAGMVTNITMMQDTFSNLERIANTPLPFAYQAHLRLSLWIYLFLLPFQIEEAFGYLAIPGTAFASFLLLGFLEIGQEIENPFNYDANDLDLDSFCLSIQRELQEITVHTAPNPDEFVFSAWNQPFAPADRRTAEEIINAGDYKHHTHPEDVEPGMNSLRRTLLRSWKDVDAGTRHH